MVSFEVTWVVMPLNDFAKLVSDVVGDLEKALFDIRSLLTVVNARLFQLNLSADVENKPYDKDNDAENSVDDYRVSPPVGDCISDYWVYDTQPHPGTVSSIDSNGKEHIDYADGDKECRYAKRNMEI